MRIFFDLVKGKKSWKPDVLARISVNDKYQDFEKDDLEVAARWLAIQVEEIEIDVVEEDQVQLSQHILDEEDSLWERFWEPKRWVDQVTRTAQKYLEEKGSAWQFEYGSRSEKLYMAHEVDYSGKSYIVIQMAGRGYEVSTMRVTQAEDLEIGLHEMVATARALDGTKGMPIGRKANERAAEGS